MLRLGERREGVQQPEPEREAALWATRESRPGTRSVPVVSAEEDLTVATLVRFLIKDYVSNSICLSISELLVTR